MPGGLLATVPEPVPVLLTVSAWALAAKVAVTVLAAVRMTVQFPVPVQAPLQPVNAKPAAGVAVSVTWVLAVKATLQVAPQLMPAGLLVTEPLPTTETARGKVAGAVPLRTART